MVLFSAAPLLPNTVCIYSLLLKPKGVEHIQVSSLFGFFLISYRGVEGLRPDCCSPRVWMKLPYELDYSRPAFADLMVLKVDHSSPPFSFIHNLHYMWLLC